MIPTGSRQAISVAARSSIMISLTIVYAPKYWLHPAVPLIFPSSKRAVIVVPEMGERTSSAKMKEVSVQIFPSMIGSVGVEVGVDAGNGASVVVRVGGGVGADDPSSSMHPADIKTAAIATMAIKSIMVFFFIVLAPVVRILCLFPARSGLIRARL
jgi:hypothetical protein